MTKRENKLPKKLYKYEPWSIQSLQNLKNQEIYFGPPRNFNDPFDCNLHPRITHLSDDEIIKLREFYLNQECTTEEIKTQLKTYSNGELRTLFSKTAHDHIKETIESFLDNRGVTCFSEINDNLLMWAHYAGKYQGFCLEFDAGNYLFNKAEKVSYKKELPEFSMSEMMLKEEGPYKAITALFRTKSCDWSYEKEWRIIHAKAGTAYGYDAKALTGIYFGPQIPFANMEIIMLIIQGQNPDVRFYQGSRSTSHYKIEFKQIEYLPHVKK